MYRTKFFNFYSRTFSQESSIPPKKRIISGDSQISKNLMVTKTPINEN